MVRAHGPRPPARPRPQTPAGALDDFRRRLVDAAGVEDLGPAVGGGGYSRGRDALGRRAREDQHLTDEYPEESRAPELHVSRRGRRSQRPGGFRARDLDVRSSGGRLRGPSGYPRAPPPPVPVRTRTQTRPWEYHVDAGSMRARGLSGGGARPSGLKSTPRVESANRSSARLPTRVQRRGDRGNLARNARSSSARRVVAAASRPRAPAPAPRASHRLLGLFPQTLDEQIWRRRSRVPGGEWRDARPSGWIWRARPASATAALFHGRPRDPHGRRPAAARRLTVALEGFAAAEAAAEGLAHARRRQWRQLGRRRRRRPRGRLPRRRARRPRARFFS